MTLFTTKANRLRVSVGLVVVLIGLALCVPAFSDPVGPTARDRQIALTVASLLKREHLSRHPLDDEISERCMERFVQSLDPRKDYFYQSDVDSFMAYREDLDDRAKRGDITFAYMAFNVFLQRVDERVKLVEELLMMQHDFAVEEEMFKDWDSATYPRNEAEARERWRKRVKFELLSLKADKEKEMEGQAAINKLTRRYKSFQRRMHQTDGEELLEMYLTALSTAFDPHTSYMSPRTHENFLIIMRLELEGIGAALQSIDGYTVVNKIIPGGAADKDGRLKPEDRIVGVGQGTDGEIEDVVDMKLAEVVQRIRGKAGTVVLLEVTAANSPESKIVDITRAKIELNDSAAQYEIFSFGQRSDGRPYQIGVIDLPSFYMDMEGAKRGVPNYKSTTRDVKKILETFNDKGVDAVILDLRRNGGGSLTEAINLTGLFIDDGPVVQVKDADGHVQPYHDLDEGVVWTGPLIVLTSKFSASASEILAGAVQDYRRGLIVGDRATHGKGTVQSLMDLGLELFRIPGAPKLGALKITMQQFYRPSGESTQKRGVLADIELPSLSTHYDVAEADLDYPIEFDRVEPLDFDKLDYVTPAMCDRLRRLSEQRRNESKDFQRVYERIALYLQQKDRKTVTLNEEQFMEELERLNADKEEEEALEKMSDSSDQGIERDYYLDEALAIAADYLQLMLVAQAN